MPLHILSLANRPAFVRASPNRTTPELFVIVALVVVVVYVDWLRVLNGKREPIHQLSFMLPLQRVGLFFAYTTAATNRRSFKIPSAELSSRFLFRKNSSSGGTRIAFLCLLWVSESEKKGTVTVLDNRRKLKFGSRCHRRRFPGEKIEIRIRREFIEKLSTTAHRHAAMNGTLFSFFPIDGNTHCRHRDRHSYCLFCTSHVCWLDSGGEYLLEAMGFRHFHLLASSTHSIRFS